MSIDSVLQKKKASDWICGNFRVVIFYCVWFDVKTQKYMTKQHLGLVYINSWENIFKISNGKWSAQLTKVNNLKPDWPNWSIGVTKADPFTKDNPTKDKYKFEFSNSDDININVDNIIFYPQGKKSDVKEHGRGFVPTDKNINAYSFSCMNAKATGKIGSLSLNTPKYESYTYIESVMTNNNASLAANFACVYVLNSSNKTTLFVCGIEDGSDDNRARGMVVTNTGKIIWLQGSGDKDGDFTLKPVISSKFYSKNTKQHFYISYQIKIKNYNIDIIVFPPLKDKDKDFGAESGSLSRWTQKALIKKAPQKFLNSQCMLEISKLN